VLMVASFTGNTAVVKLLLHAGASKYTRDKVRHKFTFT
jgi:ankyrin repeat protein